MNKNEELQNQKPITGNFIFAKNIINDGEIKSSGERPVNVINTDKYSGKGTVETKQILVTEIKFYEKWWFKYIALPLFVLLLGTFMIFKFGWNK